MLNNFRNIQSLYQSLGAHWLAFRLGYALRMQTGWIRKQMPAYRWSDRPLGTWLKRHVPTHAEEYAEWRRSNSPAFFFKSALTVYHIEEAQISSSIPWDPQQAADEAERILNGELKYFDHEFVKTGFPPDWRRDPITGISLDGQKHWSELSDEGETDIKFIWEASRFSMVYALVRAYASTRDERFAQAFWGLIQAWAEANPPNTGPNWMDGQEAALRLMAWTFGFYAFLDTPTATPERMAQFTVMVAAHAERIYKNIDYAISTRSNHTISEAFGLWLAGTLFPELKDAERYSALGRRLLEQEAVSQIFRDGSYAMYSLNYHRFILHIYLYSLKLGELNAAPFSESLKRRVAESIDYLYQLVDPETGRMPVYGSNDGALVLPLDNCGCDDYRPLLQLGSYMTKGIRLFAPGAWDEPLFWLFGMSSLSQRDHGSRSAAEWRRAGVRESRASFPDGGVYLLRGINSKAVIRCTDFRARPSHADQLHVDLWSAGRNIACDAGTYLYSGKGIWRNGLAHTSVHNTVIVDRRDQMRMVSRFTWTEWAKGKVLKHSQGFWQGEHEGYKRLADPVSHRRSVLLLSGDRWLVVDQLTGKQPHHYALHWLLCDGKYGVQNAPEGRDSGSFRVLLGMLDSTHRASELPDSKVLIQMGLLEGNGNISIVRGDENSTRGWRSRYYGQKEPAISVLFEAHQPQACFWTFFGMEMDRVELTGEVLRIMSGEWQTLIGLGDLNKGTASFTDTTEQF